MRVVVKAGLELDLADKPNTSEQDEELLKKMDQIKSHDATVVKDRLVVLFRMEKKKLLQDTIRKLS